jgi:hypothetical protein
MYGNNHYIRVDESGNIVAGFSDAFEEAQEGDICIAEGVGRQFELLGVVNPPLKTMKGVPLFQWTGAEAANREAEEIEAEEAALPPPTPSAQDDLLSMTVDHEYRLTLLELGV